MGQNVLKIRIFHVFFRGTAVCFHCVFSLSSLCPGLCSAVSALRCFTTWQLSKHWMWLRHDPGSVRDSELYPKIVLQSKGLHFCQILTQRPGTCMLVKNSWSLTGDVVCVICIQKPENREHTKCVFCPLHQCKINCMWKQPSSEDYRTMFNVFHIFADCLQPQL